VRWQYTKVIQENQTLGQRQETDYFKNFQMRRTGTWAEEKQKALLTCSAGLMNN
jgi:hypothetical protein